MSIDESSNDRQMCILVIDDETTHRILAKEYLEEAGYVVRLSDNGDHGLKLATKTSPDLILLDVMLPGIDGHKLCRSLKSDPTTANIPVILVTASRETDVIQRGLDAGAEDFITKPVDWNFLSDRVAHTLAKAEQDLNGQVSPFTLRDASVNGGNEPGAALPSAAQMGVHGENGLVVTGSEDQIADALRLSLTQDHADELCSFWRGTWATANAQLELTNELADCVASIQKLREINDESENSNAGFVDITRLVDAISVSAKDLKILAHAMSGHTKLNESTFDLGELLSNTVEKFDRLEGDRNIFVHVVKPDDAVLITADEHRLRFAVLKLIINAIIFAPPGGEVHVELLEPSDGWVRVRVSDEGSGISPAQLQQLRNSIDQSAFPLSQSGEGEGFGLPISNALARLHGGQIEIDSLLGEGTHVSILIPESRLQSDRSLMPCNDIEMSHAS